MKQRFFLLSQLYADEGFLQEISERYPHDTEILDLRDIDGTNCYCDSDSAREILRRISNDNVLPQKKEIYVNWIDTGDYHHVSALTFTNALGRYGSEAATYTECLPFLILIDNHPDMQASAFCSDMLSCGGWVRDLVEQKGIGAVFALGTTPELDCEIEEMPQAEKLSIPQLSSALPQNTPFYLSIDLDVLEKKEFSTDWDQGKMSFDELCLAIRQCLTAESIPHLMGIDICGGLTSAKGATDKELQSNKALRFRLIALLSELLSSCA